MFKPSVTPNFTTRSWIVRKGNNQACKTKVALMEVMALTMVMALMALMASQW